MSDDASSSSDITCYDCFGNESDTRFPCSLDGSLTQCCRKNQVCAWNGICLSDDEDEAQFLPYAVEGCTDRRWNSQGYVDECLNHHCPGLGDDGLCCYGTQGCNCNSLNNQGIFRREAARGIVTLDPSGLLPASETPTSASSTTSVNATTASPTTSNTADSETSSSANEPESSPTPSSVSNSSTTPLALEVGLGVSIPFVLVIATLAFCLHRRKRRSREKHENGAAPITISPPSTSFLSDGGGMYHKPQCVGDYHIYSSTPMLETQSPPAELSGAGQLIELPTEYHGNDLAIGSSMPRQQHPGTGLLPRSSAAHS